MTYLLKLLIRAYQIVISPLLGPKCRFYPTCSHYAVSCLDIYAPKEALVKIGQRLIRCHPFNPGGIDLP